MTADELARSYFTRSTKRVLALDVLMQSRRFRTSCASRRRSSSSS